MAPAVRPWTVMNSCVSWLSTSTRALPMATTSSLLMMRRSRGAALRAHEGHRRALRERGGDAVALEHLGRRAQTASLGLDAAVERGALFEWAAERLDDRVQLGLVELLPVARASGARDVLVHQRAAEVVAPGLERLPGAAHAGLHPRHLHVVDPPPVRDATDRVHEEDLAHRRSLARLLLEEDRCGHVHERQRHELGEAARLLLHRACAH